MDIDSFTQEYQFLSLSFLQMGSPINYDGRLWISALHLFSALKTENKILRDKVRAANSPADAEALSREVPLRPNWEAIKLDVMRLVLKLKFSNSNLREKLLATGNHSLINRVTNGDMFWGVCAGRGENHLGRLLMVLRAKLLEGQDAWPTFNKCSVCEYGRRAGAPGYVGCALWCRQVLDHVERRQCAGGKPETEEVLYKACVSPAVYEVMRTGWVYLNQRPDHVKSTNDTVDKGMMTNGMVVVPGTFRCDKYHARAHY